MVERSFRVLPEVNLRGRRPTVKTVQAMSDWFQLAVLAAHAAARGDNGKALREVLADFHRPGGAAECDYGKRGPR